MAYTYLHEIVGLEDKVREIVRQELDAQKAPVTLSVTVPAELEPDPKSEPVQVSEPAPKPAAKNNKDKSAGA